MQLLAIGLLPCQPAPRQSLHLTPNVRIQLQPQRNIRQHARRKQCLTVIWWRAAQLTFDIPDLQSAIEHTTTNQAPIVVVGTCSDGNPARFSQLWLNDRLLEHIPGVPHTYGPIITASHAGVLVSGVPLCVCAGTDVTFGVTEVPDIHVARQTDPALFAVSVVHLDLGGAGGHQEGITCCTPHCQYNSTFYASALASAAAVAFAAVAAALVGFVAALSAAATAAASAVHADVIIRQDRGQARSPDCHAGSGAE